MIHSKDKDPSELFSFCERYNQLPVRLPLVVVPTAFNQIYEEDLLNAGVSIVIYANHLLRAAYPSMLKTAKLILENERSKEGDDVCMPIKEILELIPGGKW